MIRSLRLRLLLSTSLASILVLGLLGISVYAAMRHALLDEFEASLRADARLLSSMVQQKQNSDRLEFEFDPQQMTEFLSEKHGRFFQIWQDDGKVLARSPSLKSGDLPKAAVPFGSLAAVELPADRDGRAVLVAATAQHEDHDDKRPPAQRRMVTIMVAAEPVEVDRTLRLLGLLLTSLCAGAIVIMGAVLLRAVTQGIQPVRRLATRIEELNVADLSHRFQDTGVPEELTPVVDKLNGLLGRLDAAFTREKGFTADVAHELRTPLTGLSATLEVCRSRPRDSAAYETAIDECRAITDRMATMVESLLVLARSDSGQIPMQCEAVNVSQLIGECWEPSQARAEQRKVKTFIDVLDPCVIETDAEKLRIVLNNLLDNAISYVDDAGEIRINSTLTNREVIVQIGNTGSQISAEDIPNLFRRFWRGDSARSSGTHCGLGLALSQRLIHLLDGDIKVVSSIGADFEATVRLPISAPRPRFPTSSGGPVS